jgi:hypothetical protein
MFQIAMRRSSSSASIAALFLHALHECLAALHLVGRRTFDDLHDHGVGGNVAILHHRLGDVIHQRFLGLVAAAGDEIDGDFGHWVSPDGRHKEARATSGADLTFAAR